ncbi:ecto-ADP-ribosyltransferase 5-like [Ambystoma mexicanum]|uniref:ecto-ADP-ribosyltransferase 5-like n=1 Tax=Ambystoma mexicanum TaxID=8296 RepID=UPI0037E94AA7
MMSADSMAIVCAALSALVFVEFPKVNGQVQMLDMAPNCFDDQYIDCADKMEKVITASGLLKQEMDFNQDFKNQWSKAKEAWAQKKKTGKMPPLPQGFKEEYGMALLTYTGTDIHKQFNNAVRVGSQSRDHYMERFLFKSLHFYMTRALQLLRKSCRTSLQVVYRGVRSIRFVPPSGSEKRIRYGQFTSISLDKSTASAFGTDTFFTIRTCFGVQIANFSLFPTESEVLSPANEVFTVSAYTEAGHKLVLNSTQRTCSKYNCTYLGDFNLINQSEQFVVD